MPLWPTHGAWAWQDAPDRDVAVCKILMFTAKEAAHLEPFSPDELFHCGHCALLGGLHLTALHYFRRGRENLTVGVCPHVPQMPMLQQVEAYPCMPRPMTRASCWQDVTASVNYGTALYLAGNVPAAIDEWTRVMKMDPMPTNKEPNTEATRRSCPSPTLTPTLLWR
jgi:hypothetical protein